MIVTDLLDDDFHLPLPSDDDDPNLSPAPGPRMAHQPGACPICDERRPLDTEKVANGVCPDCGKPLRKGGVCRPCRLRWELTERGAVESPL